MPKEESKAAATTREIPKVGRKPKYKIEDAKRFARLHSDLLDEKGNPDDAKITDAIVNTRITQGSEISIIWE